jgi:hypothetical protein
MVIKEVIHKGHVIELHHNGLWIVISTMEKFSSLAKAKQSLQEYHYEYAAYTDNLCWGRVKICQGRDRHHVEQTAWNSNKGCYVIERVRVAN